jgi:hypothetical protein
MSKKEKEVKEPTALELQYAKVLNPKAFVDVKKAEFKEQFKGRLPFDLNLAWVWITKNR